MWSPTRRENEAATVEIWEQHLFHTVVTKRKKTVSPCASVYAKKLSIKLSTSCPYEAPGAP